MMKRNIFIISFLILGAALQLGGQTRYDLNRMQRERLGRGTVAVRMNPDSVMVSWRYLSEDARDMAFNVYRDGKRCNETPIADATLFYDRNTSERAAKYVVKGVVNGKETELYAADYVLKEGAQAGFIGIPTVPPADGVTPDGRRYSYSANDASIGDVDGDGKYEIVLKWEPSNAQDNSSDGFTGDVFLDAYKLTGERLWRIDLGRNIRAGAHYTQFMVYDFDGDGRAEIVCKTADGTVDGTGKVIGDSTADYRVGVAEAKSYLKEHPMNANDGQNGRYRPWRPDRRAGRALDRTHRKPGMGRILSGPEYLTVFEGATGRELATVNYEPPRGNVLAWGDSYGNRCDRFLACVAYLDGIHPSVVMCRGYYTRTVLAAYDWNGKTLQRRWIFDSDTPGNGDYAGQGNHNLSVADVDGDGCDEIVYGSCCFDHNGKGLYSTGRGHGDAMHLTAFFPNNDALQVWDCHENRRDGSELHDARTGKILWQRTADEDVGRCMAADIDPNNPGLEMWSANTEGICSVKGKVINDRGGAVSDNMAVWWDGDLLRELLDRERITKYDARSGRSTTLKTFDGCRFNNWTKSNPCLQGDIAGDWREEVVCRTADSRELRIYVSTLPTTYRFHTFLEDPVYRISIATENVAYNQPTQTGFYFGSDLKRGKWFRGTLIK
jgi:rhamnogalacturonan endolyase